MARDMTRGRPSKILITFAFSILTSSILNYVYNATDSAMVSYFVDKHALGAISSITPTITLIQGLLLGLLSGFSITISRAFGAKLKEKMKKALANGIFIAFLIVVPIMIISFFAASPITYAMNVPEQFRGDAIAYFLVIILALPISGTSWMCAGLFRAFGDSRTPMIISACCGALNVFFNYVFLAIIPLGVAGAAIGTVCASAIGTVIYLVVLLRTTPEIKFKLADIRPRSALIKELLNDGIALAMLDFVVSAGQVVLQRAINSFEPAVITGVAAGSKLVNLLWLISCALESALIYFCSQNAGAGEIGRIKQGIKANLIITTVVVSLCVAAILIFCEPLLRIFIGSGIDADTSSTISHATTFIITQVVFLPAIILMSGLRGAARGLGSAVPTVACGVIELVARIGVTMMCELSAFAEDIKIKILYLAGPAAWVGAVIMLAIILPGTLKRKEIQVSQH